MGLPTLMHRNIGGVLLFSSFEGSISEQETKEMGCLQESTNTAADKTLSQRLTILCKGILRGTVHRIKPDMSFNSKTGLINPYPSSTVAIYSHFVTACNTPQLYSYVQNSPVKQISKMIRVGANCNMKWANKGDSV